MESVLSAYMEPNIKSITLPCTFKIEEKYNIGAVTLDADALVAKCLRCLFLIQMDARGRVIFCVCQGYGMKRQRKSFLLLLWIPKI